MKVYDINSERFKEYGRVVNNIDFSAVIKELKNMTIPEDVVYEPSISALEDLISDSDSLALFGGIPYQAGYCAGHNAKLNAVEYHRSSEFNVAATDAVLLLGRQQDITDDFKYDTSDIEAFVVPAGTTVELYATTLHYAPCREQNKGFMVGVILPKGTNEPLKNEACGNGDSVCEKRLLTAANKWLIGHKDAGLDDDAYIGLTGKNINIDED